MPDDAAELLARWKEIVAAMEPDAVAHFTDEGPPDYLLHLFRPSGAGVEALLVGMAEGDEILARLRKVFRAAGDGSRGDMYFIVRKPPHASADQILDWACDQLARMRRVERTLWKERSSIDDIKGVDLWVGGAPPRRNPGRVHPLESDLYRIVTELGHSRPASLHGSLLEEPLYKLACDYRLAHWVRWPEMGKAFPVEEPFDPWFQLWRHGAELIFSDEDSGWSFDQDSRVRVWVARTA
jgi:hypothetical protein